MLCFFYIACDVSITLAEQTSTIFTKIVAKQLAERGYIVQDTPPAIGKDYNDYLLAARRLISMER